MSGDVIVMTTISAPGFQDRHGPPDWRNAAGSGILQTGRILPEH
jgi:hypothetical protein